MKVAIIGTRGIPAAYGGFETFAFHLSVGMAKEGIEVTVVNEKSHYGKLEPDLPVQILHSDFNKSSNPLRFYKDSLLKTVESHDVVLVCGVGGALFYPRKKNAALLVTNVDGLEHLRKKYSFLQRALVFLLQAMANRKSDFLIADSNSVERYWQERFKGSSEKLTAIAYGADLITEASKPCIEKYGLSSGNYWLIIARLVPENNIAMIIEGYKRSGSEKKLVILGDVSDNSYSREMEKFKSEQILFPGAIYEQDTVRSLRYYAFAYLHGHSVGGTNPSLIEAMAAGCACVCFKTVFNSEVVGNSQLFFESSEDLSVQLKTLESNVELRQQMKTDAFAIAKSKYSWNGITQSYISLFKRLLREQK